MPSVRPLPRPISPDPAATSSELELVTHLCDARDDLHKAMRDALKLGNYGARTQIEFTLAHIDRAMLGLTED